MSQPDILSKLDRTLEMTPADAFAVPPMPRREVERAATEIRTLRERIDELQAQLTGDTPAADADLITQAIASLREAKATLFRDKRETLLHTAAVQAQLATAQQLQSVVSLLAHAVDTKDVDGGAQ